MAEKRSIPQEDVNKLVDIQKRYVELTRRIGETTYSKKLIEIELKQLEYQIEDLEAARFSVMEELETKYGKGTINIETAEFIPEN